MSDKETVSGSLDIAVWVTCPSCEHYINLLDESDTNNQDLNEEGHVLNQACPDGHWSEKHNLFKVNNVCCSQCKNEFNVKGLEW